MTKDKKDRLGKLLAFGSVGATVLTVLLACAFVVSQPRITERGCIEHRPPSGHTAIIFDVTDPLSEDQCRASVGRIRRAAREELKPNEMLSIWVLGDFPDGALHPLFCLCDPGVQLNPFVQSPREVRARRDSLFGKPLEEAIGRLAHAQTAPRSPLMEGTQELAELKDFIEAAGPRRILFVSDMLQNTERFSQYRHGADFEGLRRSSMYPQLKADLKNVAIEILYLHRKRDGAFQGPEHRDFWRDYLRDCGASSVTFSRF